MEDYIPIESHVIINVIKSVDNLISDINKELQATNIILNDEFIGILHKLELLMIWYLYYTIELYKSQEIHRLNNQSKKSQYDLFVSNLCKNTEKSDNLLYNKLTDTILETIYGYHKKKVIDDVKCKLDHIAPYFHNSEAMKLLDDSLVSKNMKVENIISIIVDPITFLNDEYERNWKAHTEKMFANAKKDWNIGVSSDIQEAKNYFIELEKELKLHKLYGISSSLYKVTCDKNTKVDISNVEREFYDEKTLEFFLKTLIGTWTNINVNRSGYQITTAFPEYKSFIKMLPHLKDIFNLINLQNSPVKYIGNIKTVLTGIIDRLSVELLNYNQKLPDDSTLDFANKRFFYKDLYIGCHEFCALCGRKCDENHIDSSKEKHKCNTGHRFKVFAGSKIEGSNYPSFISCDKMKDDSKIKYKGEMKTWKDFTQSMPKWDYTCGISSQKLNEIKNKEIWESIGKEICNYYTTIKGITINHSNYTTYNTILENTLIIYALDCSGSMEGGKWNDLMKALNDSLKHLISLDELKEYVQVAIIVYDDNIVQVIEPCDPDTIKTSEIIMNNGGTDFDKPLRKAHDLIIENLEEFDRFKLLFMSDGCADLPNDSINLIRNHPDILKLTDIDFVYYGGSPTETFTVCADKLNGKICSAVDVSQLSKNFIEIISTIKQK